MQRVALAVVVREGRVLLARRPAGGHLPGLWEFPGGKVEPGEEPAAAALRELAEETGLAGGHAERLAVVEHDYGDRKVQLWAYLVTGASGRPRHHAGEELTWLPPEALAEAAMPAANRPLLAVLRRRLAGDDRPPAQ